MRKVYLGQYGYAVPPGTYIAEIIPYKPEVITPVPIPPLAPPPPLKPPVARELLVTDTASAIEKVIQAAGSWPPWE